MHGLLGLKTRFRRMLKPGEGSPPVAAAPVAVATVPGPFQGYVDSASVRHAAGWVRDLGQPGNRVEFEVVATIEGVPRIVHRGVADEHTTLLQRLGIGDGRHAFYGRFDTQLTPAERDTIRVLVSATGEALELAPAIEREWNPIRYVALDIVDNCNLRCPFCLFDYTGVNKTNVMNLADFASALRLLPYTSLGNFWLSCLHEPTLHPKFEKLLGMIPQDQRRKIFYTTNLAKKMPQSYYEFLAESGLHNLNISVESFDPEIYEKMRKGARHRIFSVNWDIMLEAFARGSAPPKVRYIIMAYRSNLAELPTLVRRLRDEKHAWQVEIRYTYPERHIPAAFSAAEFLNEADWTWLRVQLAGYDPNEVLLIAPPPGYDESVTIAAEKAKAPGAEPGPSSQFDPVRSPVRHPEPGGLAKPREVELRLWWNGRVHVTAAKAPGDYHNTSMRPTLLADVHITEIDDVDAFLCRLVA
jgi:Radical SAM superfamily